MCAIFGIVGKSDPHLLKKISTVQLFRGPDSQKFYFNKEKSFCFGNNRLAVIDKEGGIQPMYSEDKSILVVFNGTIYNFKEIKKYLQNKNVVFASDSDTEVVANSYMYWGNKMFNYLDGMWALSIYDKKKDEVILSRDYIGQKPLFYFKKNNCIFFSSQLRGFFVDEKNKFEIEKNNLKKFLIFSYLPAPHTLYKDIYQVEPGEYLTINLKSIEIIKTKYWKLENGPDYNLFFDKTTIDQFKSVFVNTVNQHTIADKTPALLLSGGLDSFLIADQIKKKFDNLKSFSIGFTNPSYDETEFIKKLDLNFDKKIFLPEENDFSNYFNKLSKLVDEPFGDSSLLPSFMIFDKIREFTNVAIGGDGGDENFFGYITFDAFYLSLILKKFIPKIIFNIISKITNFLPISNKYISLGYKINKFFSQANFDKKYLNTLWLSSMTLKELEDYFNEEVILDEIFPEIDELFSKNLPDMRLCQLYYFKFYLPMVLSKVDKASMFNSIESRSPFLGKNIINFSLDIDANENFKFLRSKYLLKKIFSKEIPSIIKKKKKHGFALPLSEFLKSGKNIEKYIKKKYIYNEKFFFKKLALAKRGDIDAQKYIWNELILNLSIQNTRDIKI